MFGVPGLGAGGLTPGVRWLLVATGAAFVLQLALEGAVGMRLTPWFALSRDGLLGGYLWQPLTYLFLHGGIWHIALNMFMLFMFGREVETILGTRRFLPFYFACGAIGGVGWLLLSWNRGVPCIGASGAVFGVLGAFAAFFPERRVTLLLMFVLPVTMSARTLAIGLGLLSLFSMMGGDGNIAHAAHLAGGVAGYLAARRFVQRGRRSARAVRRGAAGAMHVRSGYPPPSDEAPAPPSEDDVNLVLEKISRHGIRSLTRAERDVLERASEARYNA